MIILASLKNKQESTKIQVLKDSCMLDELNRLTPSIKSLTNKIKIVLENGSDVCMLCEKDKINESRIKYRMLCDACSRRSAAEKTENTNMSRYGVKNVFQSLKTKNKIKQTNLDRFGVENPLQSDKIKDKIKQTNLDRLGVEHPLQSKEIYDKLKKTNLDRLGVEHSHQNSEVRDKARSTIIERYGEFHVVHRNKKTFQSRHAENSEILYWSQNIEKLYTKYVDEKLTIIELSEKTGVNRNTIQGWFASNGYERFNRKTSYEEKKFADLIQTSFGTEIIRNTRSVIPPYEIDMWFPDKNLGIEYHGIYWHRNDPHKTINKCKLASKTGIQLLQFFSNEVEEKTDIVMSIIASKIGKSNRHFARNTKFGLVDSKTYRNFCDKNHLQGYAAALVKCGLYDENNELLAVMSFGKSRYDKRNQWEMVRFCCKLNTSVVGGPSKLLKNFIKVYDPQSIVTYADARISAGNMYRRLGFRYSHHSAPNYKYTNDYNTLHSRIKFQKHKLKNVLDTFDSNLSGKENMTRNGYSMVYDAGNYIFEWSKT